MQQMQSDKLKLYVYLTTTIWKCLPRNANATSGL